MFVIPGRFVILEENLDSAPVLHAFIDAWGKDYHTKILFEDVCRFLLKAVLLSQTP